MSNLRLFEPRLFEPALGEPFDALFKRFMAPMRMELDNGSLDMRLDIAEIDGSYKVRADLPGVRKDDINVRIDGNIVQIDAEVKPLKDVAESGARMLRNERCQGPVSRVFTLAQDVDDAKAVAKYEDGVLTLDLPKKASAPSRRLAIQ